MALAQSGSITPTALEMRPESLTAHLRSSAITTSAPTYLMLGWFAPVLALRGPSDLKGELQLWDVWKFAITITGGRSAIRHGTILGQELLAGRWGCHLKVLLLVTFLQFNLP